jgi:putative Mn2+ efflux pump MntP
MKSETAKTLRAFVIELVMYAALVVGYFFLVLHFLGSWLYQLETHHAKTYAGVAILLIIGQAVVLESVTTFLLRLIRGRSE